MKFQLHLVYFWLAAGWAQSFATLAWAEGNNHSIYPGSIDPHVLEQAIVAHRLEFKDCYQKNLKPIATLDGIAKSAEPAGIVKVDFTVIEGGTVSQATLAKSTLMSQPQIESCVLKQLKKIRFPVPKGTGTIKVSYTFKFHVQ